MKNNLTYEKISEKPKREKYKENYTSAYQSKTAETKENEKILKAMRKRHSPYRGTITGKQCHPKDSEMVSHKC